MEFHCRIHSNENDGTYIIIKWKAPILEIIYTKQRSKWRFFIARNNDEPQQQQQQQNDNR